MVKTDVWHESYRRWTLKEKKIAIARALGMDVRTVCKGLRQKSLRPYERERKRTPLLVGFEDWIRNRVAAVGYCAQAVFEDIKDKHFLFPRRGNSRSWR